MRRLVTGFAAALAALLLAGVPAMATEYRFKLVADTTGPFDYFSAPSINSNGAIAFVGRLKAGGSGVFRLDDSSLTTIADSSGPLLGFLGSDETSSAPSIAADGMVAFLASSNSGRSGIYTGSGGSLTSIAESGDEFQRLWAPRINGSGMVAFRGETPAGKIGISVSGDGALYPVVSPSESFSGLGIPSLNDAGRVGFASGEGVFSRLAGVTDTIASLGDTYSFFPTSQAVNNTGTTVFRATLAKGPDALIIANRLGSTTIAQTGAKLSALDVFSLADSDNVVFTAFGHGPGRGLYLWDKQLLALQVVPGDALFGSIVRDIAISDEAITSTGQIAFHARLTDGRRVIGLAEPVPDPRSILLASVSLGLVLRVRRLSS